MSNYVLDQRTVSPILYNSLHPEQHYSSRRRSIKDLRDLDINIGSSMMIGFPNQDLWDLADDFSSILESKINMLIVGPFVAGSTSPLADSPRGTIQSALNAIAVARLLFKDVFIPAGPSFGTLDSGSTVEALRWGADGVILHLQPADKSGDCVKTSRSIIKPDLDYVTTRVCSLGRVMST